VGYRVSSPNFVGRAEELDLLDAAYDAVTGGRPATILIGGDAGIGAAVCRSDRSSGSDETWLASSATLPPPSS
jgi:hypothetical protein